MARKKKIIKIDLDEGLNGRFRCPNGCEKVDSKTITMSWTAYVIQDFDYECPICHAKIKWIDSLSKNKKKLGW